MNGVTSPGSKLVISVGDFFWEDTVEPLIMALASGDQEIAFYLLQILMEKV